VIIFRYILDTIPHCSEPTLPPVCCVVTFSFSLNKSENLWFQNNSKHKNMAQKIEKKMSRYTMSNPLLLVTFSDCPVTPQAHKSVMYFMHWPLSQVHNIFQIFKYFQKLIPWDKKLSFDINKPPSRTLASLVLQIIIF